MKLSPTLGALGLAILSASFCPIALAQVGVGGPGGSGGGASGPGAVADQPGWYGGFSIGQSRANIDEARITSGLLGAGFTSTSIAKDDRDTGYKAFAGYQVNRNFAIEGGFFDLGKFGFTATTVPPGTLNGSIKLRGLNLDAVGMLPIADRFSVFGRAGFAYAQARDSFGGAGLVVVTNPNPNKSETNYKIGAGLQYDFSAALGMRLEAERYRVNDAVGSRADIDVISLGLVYRFGHAGR
jgi:OmpA-OmpF porin, OOP family